MFQSDLIVAKFGGTSVADFSAMNRSADVVLANANVRLVVLSASAGVTNLLVALAEGRSLRSDSILWMKFAVFSTPLSIGSSSPPSSAKRSTAYWKISPCCRKRRRWRPPPP